MSEYLELKKQAQALLAKAEQVRLAETRQVMAGIVETMNEYGLTIDDLKGYLNGKTAKEPRYRDPETSKTWTGHGRVPGWMPEDKSEWDAYRL